MSACTSGVCLGVDVHTQMDRSAASLLKALCATGISAGACKGSLVSAHMSIHMSVHMAVHTSMHMSIRAP